MSLERRDLEPTFRRASMRPGQEAPDERCLRSVDPYLQPASMRPGQEAPDERLTR